MRQALREARKQLGYLWVEASPLGSSCWYPPDEPRWHTITRRALRPAGRLAARFRAARHLIAGPEKGEIVDMPGLRYRLKALALIWLPVRWHYPSYPSDACEVIGYDDTTWQGAECTFWEATFVAVQPGFRLGLAHIYREGGP